MPDIRLWHHGLDQYHTAFRCLVLLQYRQKAFTMPPLKTAVLRILDMYFAYPQLLHTISYKQEVRQQLKALSLPKPDQCFINIPPAKSLIRSMEPVQKMSLKDLAAKRILDKEHFVNGQSLLVSERLEQRLQMLLDKEIDKNYPLISFITGNLGVLDINGPESIFRISRVHREFS